MTFWSRAMSSVSSTFRSFQRKIVSGLVGLNSESMIDYLWGLSEGPGVS